MSRTRRRAWMLVAIGLSIMVVGCVRRTLTINTQPQGATISLNDEVIGTTPVSTDFLWYGDYDVIARKEGYETLKTHHRLRPPWYELPAIDIFSEVLAPFWIHDRREVTFALSAATQPSREELIEDAKRIRDEALYGSE